MAAPHAPTASPRRGAIAFILATALLDVMAMGIVIPVLPQLIEHFSGSTARAGLLNGAFVALWAAMQFLASPVIGALSDRFGRRPVILVSCAGLAADYLLMALAPSLWWLALGRIIAGATSASFTAAFAYMADVTPPGGRARAFGLLGAAFSAGFVAGPLIGGVLGEWGPRAPFWAAAGLSSVAFFYGLLILPESLPPEHRTRFSWTKANPLGALALLRSHRELTGLAAVNFLLYFAHHVFSAVFVLYAGHRYGWSTGQIGVLLALVGLLDMAVQGLLVGRIVGRIGDRRTMVIGLLAGALGIACMGLAPNGWLFAAAMLPNALWGLAMPTIQSLTTRLVGEDEQGALQGALGSLGSLAGVVSPLFFGAVYSASVQPGSPLPGSGSALIIAAAVLLGAAFLGRAVTARR